jgi:DNA-binding MarR family transcriptional regulator
MLEHSQHCYYYSSMDENIGTLLSQVARLMRRAFDERARTIGVTRPQWQVLVLLGHHEGINQGGLAEILEVEPITLGRMIDRLQDVELVERKPDPSDRRAWRLYLTDKAHVLLDNLKPLADEMFESMLEGISSGTRQELTAGLLRMRANLSRKTADIVDPVSG